MSDSEKPEAGSWKPEPNIWHQHPDVPWVQFIELSTFGGWLIRNDKTGGIEAAINEEEFARKIVSASQVNDHFQLGEAVHTVTQALGLIPCLPCQRRRAWLNSLIKKVF